MHYITHLEGGLRRVSPAAELVGDYIYSFGGYWSIYLTVDDSRYNEPIDVYVLNTNTMRWSVVPQNKNEDGTLLKYPQVPFNRYAHTVVAYKNKIYMWGGRNGNHRCNILYCFNPNTLSWSQPHVTGVKPCARYGHSACVVANSMYIFGGFVSVFNRSPCDVLCLNLDTMEWSYVQTSGIPPSVRDHSASAINNQMYIFGGSVDNFFPYNPHDEMHRPEIVYLDLKTKVWHRPLTTGEIPVGRRGHSMFTYNDLIYVFGGFNRVLGQHFNDLYAFNPKTNCWKLVKPLGRPPSARQSQVCVVKGTRMYLFGGIRPNLQTSTSDIGTIINNNDTHVLDFEPNLKTLALLAIIKYRLDTSYLPQSLKWEIRSMTQPNSTLKSCRLGLCSKGEQR